MTETGTAITDPSGYDAYAVRHSYLLPTAVALLLLAFGASSFMMLLPQVSSSDASVIANLLDAVIKAESDETLNLSFNEAHIGATIVFIAFVAVAFVVLSYWQSDRQAFMTAYPHLRLFYSEDEKRKIAAYAHRLETFGVIGLVAAVALFVIFKVFGLDHLATGFGFCVAAAGVWCYMHGYMAGRRTDLFAYNFAALKRTSIYSLKAYQKGPDREAILTAKRASIRSQSINRVVLVTGALLSFVFYFLPTFYTPLYWTPLALAGIIMFVVAHVALREARSAIGKIDPQELPDNKPDRRSSDDSPSDRDRRS